MNDWILLPSCVIAVAAVTGLFLNWKALSLNRKATNENSKTQQLRLLGESFDRIIKLDYSFYTEFKDKKKEEDWKSLYFNSIEFFSFLVNEKFIKDKKLVDFFRDAVITWYERIFIKKHSPEQISNKKLYPEFKKLYHRIKYESMTVKGDKKSL